jgi:3-hydroxybutyryl-CoA dehydrogenase
MAIVSVERLTVLGSGVLGGQIGWHSAFKGKTVVIYDPFPDALANARAILQRYATIYAAQFEASEGDLAATRTRVRFSNNLADAVRDADLVIECVPEVPAVKTAVYRDMAPLLPSHTLVATNSSTLLPRDFAEATGRPDRFCALHFANLIWSVNLVEVMAHPGTSQETLTSALHFAIEIGQVPIPVQKEHNRYVLNSWLVPLMSAALTLVVKGVATAEDVDRTYMIANRGCRMGPLGMADVVGMKTIHDISSYWGAISGDRQSLENAAYIKARFLDKGLQGMQGGEGFYKYPDPSYAAPGFLAVPSAASIPELVARTLPG